MRIVPYVFMLCACGNTHEIEAKFTPIPPASQADWCECYAAIEATEDGVRCVRATVGCPEVCVCGPSPCDETQERPRECTDAEDRETATVGP